jgi:urate oxidase
MPVRLLRDDYGKAAIRLVKVTRERDRHLVHDLTVSVKFEGSFEAAHRAGDNSAVLPTDTMKNTVYALAQDTSLDQPERFAAALGAHFLEASAAAGTVTVSVDVHPWDRVAPAAFTQGPAETRFAEASTSRSGVTYQGGLDGLGLLKTAGSAFEGYPRDRYTTLKETTDRLFATLLAARWRYQRLPASFDATFAAAREAMIACFAAHQSKSVQHTLFAMGEAALAAVPELEQVDLTMPNRHHLVVDLTPFGLENRNDIFVATSEPHGLIRGTVARG